MTKSEIIENLYKSGKITFEEAITLASVPGKEPLVTIKEGEIVSHRNLKEETIEEFVKEIVDEYYDEKISDENMAFDSVKCVKAMNANSWKWWRCEGDEMTVDEFKDGLRSIIRDVIASLIKSYKECLLEGNINENGPYANIETGGIRVEGWIDVDYNGDAFMVIRPMFILEEGEFSLESDKFKNLL